MTSVLKKALLAVGFAMLIVIFLKSLPVAAQDPAAVGLNPAIAARPIPVDRGSAALWQTLKKLHTRASLIMFTAHPDDEDGGMLDYESTVKPCHEPLAASRNRTAK